MNRFLVRRKRQYSTWYQIHIPNGGENIPLIQMASRLPSKDVPEVQRRTARVDEGYRFIVSERNE